MTDNKAGLADLAQKAFFLGVGLASVAADKAAANLGEIRQQAQKIVQELVERGEMTAEQAQQYVNDMMQRGAAGASPDAEAPKTGPVKIDIEDEGAAGNAIELSEAAKLRQQVNDLQAELDRLRQQ